MAKRKKAATKPDAIDASTDSRSVDELADTPAIHPETSLFASDIVLRGAAFFARRAAEKAILGSRYSKQIAREAVENRSLVNTMAAYGITKIATRSVPGAILVGGGLIAKALFDRSGTRRARKRAEHAEAQDE